MILLIEIFLGLIVAIILYNLIHHFVVVRASQKYQQHFQNITTQIVRRVLDQLKAQHKLPFPINIAKSSVLSDVWGREILVFEYDFSFKEHPNENVNDFVNAFKKTLLNYCIDNHILFKQKPQVVVSDVWTYHRIVHIDIACLSNDSTFEYIQDLKRLQ